MMAEHLCKLALCVSGMQMAVNLSLALSCTKQNKGVEGEKQKQSAFVTSERLKLCNFLSHTWCSSCFFSPASSDLILVIEQVRFSTLDIDVSCF